MLKKTIEFTDYNGNPRKEDFFFNLSKAEVAEMNFSTSGGLAQMLTDMVAAQNMPKLAAIFKDILLKAYGVKSPDGRRFIKSKAISEEFSQTEAYSILYMELLSDETGKAIADFLEGVLPKVDNDAPKLEKPIADTSVIS